MCPCSLCARNSTSCSRPFPSLLTGTIASFWLRRTTFKLLQLASKKQDEHTPDAGSLGSVEVLRPEASFEHLAAFNMLQLQPGTRLHVVWASHLKTLGFKITHQRWVLVQEDMQLFCCCVMSVFYVCESLPCNGQNSVAFMHVLCANVDSHDASQVCGSWCITNDEMEHRRARKVFALDSVNVSELTVRVCDGMHTFIMSP